MTSKSGAMDNRIPDTKRRADIFLSPCTIRMVMGIAV